MQYLVVGIGGGLGAMTRLLIARILSISILGMPFSILAVNVIGCFLLGLVTEIMALYWSGSETVRYFLITGFLGGFTTFSAFSLEFALLFEKSEFFLAYLYALLSVSLSILFFFMGEKVVKLFFKLI
ncbi:MAG TPA: fluoride efflux transporter CrcB [Alphaproteobacteria bacterium]|nr:fluoride efflux transporter CrcB [Alphaproteobacteria bacterium]